MSEITEKINVAWIDKTDTTIRITPKPIIIKVQSKEDGLELLPYLNLIDKIFIMSELKYKEYEFIKLIEENVPSRKIQIEDFINKKEEIFNDYEELIEKYEKEGKDIYIANRLDWDLKEIQEWVLKRRIGVGIIPKNLYG